MSVLAIVMGGVAITASAFCLAVLVALGFAAPASFIGTMVVFGFVCWIIKRGEDKAAARTDIRGAVAHHEAPTTSLDDPDWMD